MAYSPLHNKDFLARHRRMVQICYEFVKPFSNCALKEQKIPIRYENKPNYTYGPIADLLVCLDSIWMIFEIKTNRVNLELELRIEKYRKYLPFCHYFFIAAPSNCFDRVPIPEECGIVVIEKTKALAVKRIGAFNPSPLPSTI